MSEGSGKKIIGGVDMWGNMMATQGLMDRKICKEFDLNPYLIQEEMTMALRAEIMEYAATTKCFKVWSKQGPDPVEVRLEEFADGIHFYLQRALYLGLNPQDIVDAMEEGQRISEVQDKVVSDKWFLNYLLSHAMDLISTPNTARDRKWEHDRFLTSLAYFLAAGFADGFSPADIEKAFYEKKRINQERLKSGY